MVNMCVDLFNSLNNSSIEEKTLEFPHSTNLNAANNRLEVKEVVKETEKELIHFDTLKRFHSIRDEWFSRSFEGKESKRTELVDRIRINTNKVNGQYFNVGTWKWKTCVRFPFLTQVKIQEMSAINNFQL